MFVFNIYYAVKYETADSIEKNHHLITDYISIFTFVLITFMCSYHVFKRSTIPAERKLKVSCMKANVSCAELKAHAGPFYKEPLLNKSDGESSEPIGMEWQEKQQGNIQGSY